MKMDGQAIMKYVLLGAGAVAITEVINKFMPTLLSGSVLGYTIYGAITVGKIVAAGAGILLIDSLMSK